MSYRAKRELLLQTAPRYRREASSILKTVILDELVAATGYGSVADVVVVAKTSLLYYANTS